MLLQTNKMSSERGKGATLDGENIDNSCDSLQARRFWKSEVLFTSDFQNLHTWSELQEFSIFSENGIFWTNLYIKVTQSLYRIQKPHFTNLLQNVISFDLSLFVKKTFGDTWLINIISVLIKAKPYIMWFLCLSGF